jgi:hypothetical protein
MIACTHRQLTAIYSVAKNRRPFVVNAGSILTYFVPGTPMRRPLKGRSDGHAVQSSPIFRFGELGGRQLELDRVSHRKNEPSRPRVKCRHGR